MTEYKYSTEEAINMVLDKYWTVQFDELDSIKDENYFDAHAPNNIYIICSKPRIIIDKDYINKTTDAIELKFQEQQGTKFIDHFIKMPTEGKYGIGETKIISNHFNHLKLVDDEGTIIEDRKPSSVLFEFRDQVKNKDLFDYKVLYIGQSIDEYAKMPTIKRIKKHETLLKIFSDAISKNIDKEIFLVLASFKQNNFIESLSGIPLSAENLVADNQKLEKLIVNPSRFTLAQRTTFTEASLIRYFQPDYNTKFKNSFPCKKHTSYSECYYSDINLIMVEVDFSSMDGNIYTDTTEKLMYHNPKFNLQNSADRRKMFAD